MFTRSVAACLSFFAVAAAAQAGPPLRAEINLYPHNPGPYPEGGEVFMVDISVRQVAEAPKDRLLRYAQFDFSDTHPDLLAGLSLPVTHDRILAVDDIHFWQFGSQAETVCPAGDPADPGCGEGHFIEDEYAGQRPGLVAIAFLGDLDEPLFENPDLGENANWQLPLPTDPSWLKIGTVEVTLPMADGDYLLDVMNADDADPDMGAQLRWGFGLVGNDDVTAWRAGAGEIEGGTLNFHVGEGEVIGVESWESEVYHGVDVGDVALEIADTDDWVEPRDDGIKKIRVTFDGAIDPLTAIPGNVSCAGCDVNNLAVACTAMTVTTEASDTELVIEFDTTLPDFARYKIELTGITSAGGSPVGGDTDRVLYGLVGDAGGNQRVTNADLSFIRPNRGGPGVYVDPSNVAEVRSDVNSNGRVTNADLSLVRSVRGNDARGITCP